jgi:ATP-binding cassette subfamily C protein
LHRPARNQPGERRFAPREFSVAAITALAASLAEGAGLMLLLPLLSAAGINLIGSSPAARLSSTVQRLLVVSQIPSALWLPALLRLFLVAAGIRSMLRRAQSMLAYSTMTRTELALSRRVYAAVVKAQWGFLVRQRAGGLTHLLTAELQWVGDSISLALSLVNIACLTLLYFAIALKLSASMTLLVMVMGLATMLLQRRSLERMRKSGEDLYKSVGEVYAATEEHLLNIKSVKTNNAEDRDVRLFGELCDAVARNSVSSAKHQAASAFRFEMGSLLALAVVIYLALGVLRVQPAAMLLLLAIFTRLMPQLSSLQSEAHQIANVLPSYDHVLAIESECLRHAEVTLPNADPTITAANAAPARIARDLRLEQIWFAYDTGDAVSRTEDADAGFVLRGINLQIEAGLLTAIVGPSGAGKSTIADLANGLLQPTSGRLLLDGIPLGPEEMQRWRQSVGYVGQDTVLFHQSVRENLLWTMPEASDDDLREALLLASAGFVYELPGGLDSVVGDRGILLSSGQRQRISLARALLRRPALLILDEATNALDVENEARVLDALLQALRGPERELSVLMIAHRPSAIRRADRVFEMGDGKVVRAGVRTESSPGRFL